MTDPHAAFHARFRDAATHDPERLSTLEIQRDFMARTFDYWREFDKDQRDKEGLETDGDTHIMCPPQWPTHSQLEAWSKVLRDEVAK